MMTDMPTTFPNVDSIPSGTYTGIASGWTVRILDHDVTLPFGVRGQAQMDVAVTADTIEVLASRPMPLDMAPPPAGMPDFAAIYDAQILASASGYGERTDALIDRLDGPTESEFRALALACLDQGGLSVTAQNRIRLIIESEFSS